MTGKLNTQCNIGTASVKIVEPNRCTMRNMSGCEWSDITGIQRLDDVNPPRADRAGTGRATMTCVCKTNYVPIADPNQNPLVNPLEPIEYCPLHANAGKMLEALKDVFRLMDEGWLVRNTAHDHEEDFHQKACHFLARIKAIHEALALAATQKDKP